MPDVASHTVCRLLPGTRPGEGAQLFLLPFVVRSRIALSTISSLSLSCSLCLHSGKAVYCTFVLQQVYNMVLPPKISRYLSPVTELRSLAFWTLTVRVRVHHASVNPALHRRDAWHDFCVLRLLLSRMQQSLDRQILKAAIQGDMPI